MRDELLQLPLLLILQRGHELLWKWYVFSNRRLHLPSRFFGLELLDLLGAGRRVLREFVRSAGDLPGGIVLPQRVDSARQLPCRILQCEHRERFLVRMHQLPRRHLQRVYRGSFLVFVHELPRRRLLRLGSSLADELSGRQL